MTTGWWVTLAFIYVIGAMPTCAISIDRKLSIPEVCTCVLFWPPLVLILALQGVTKLMDRHYK